MLSVSEIIELIMSGKNDPWENIPDEDVDKIDRIRALEPYYTQGKLKFRSDYERSYKQLIEQLQYFPLSKHDDGPDALEMCISGILKDNNTVPALKIPKNVVRLKGNWNQIF